MNARFFRTGLRRRFVWLLWLALLLLPAAQCAAASHGVLHAGAATGIPADGKHAPQLLHCDLCLMGAAIGGGGALPCEPLTLTLSTLRHELPRVAFHGVRPASRAHAYRSRAPPPSLP